MSVRFRNFVLIPALILCGLLCVRADEKLAEVQERFRFLSIQRQTYQLKFAARPDEGRFQIVRVPTAKWPRRENFYLRVGEVSADEQFRVKSFVEKYTNSRFQRLMSISELEIVYLPDQTRHTLVHGIDQIIPTRFAELVVAGDLERRFFVKEGDAFERSEFPGFQFTLMKVTEDAAVIKMTKEGGIEKEITVSKKVER